MMEGGGGQGGEPGRENQAVSIVPRRWTWTVEMDMDMGVLGGMPEIVWDAKSR